MRNAMAMLARAAQTAVCNNRRRLVQKSWRYGKNVVAGPIGSINSLSVMRLPRKSKSPAGCPLPGRMMVEFRSYLPLFAVAVSIVNSAADSLRATPPVVLRNVDRSLQSPPWMKCHFELCADVGVWRRRKDRKIPSLPLDSGRYAELRMQPEVGA